ncbi:MAG: hypothetical protein C0P67_007595 [Bacillota bacterium]
MEMVLFFCVAALFVSLIAISIIALRRGVWWKNHSWELPELGIQLHGHPVDRDLREMIRRLERALPEEYSERVKRRIMEKSRVGETEWRNRWFELKRFFVLTSILKRVPMYSRDVDSVWHEMLLFTRDYERFSNEFLGTYLHHDPHDQPVFDPLERTWFDWTYTLFFRPTLYSRYVWGSFFRHPMPPELLREFETSSEDQLLERYFNRESARRFEEAKRLCRFVIGTVRRAIGEARKYAERYGRDVTGLRSHLFSLKSREMEPAVWMLGALAYLSLYHAENFLAAKKKLLGRVADSGSSGAGAGYVTSPGFTEGVWDDLGCDSDSGGGDGGSSCGGAGCGGGS